MASPGNLLIIFYQLTAFKAASYTNLSLAQVLMPKLAKGQQLEKHEITFLKTFHQIIY